MSVENIPGNAFPDAMIWTCEKIESRLGDYLDGLLSAEERHAFDLHVNTCPRCTPLVSSVAQLVAQLHSMEEVEPPPRLAYSILDKTIGPRESLTGWRALPVWIRHLVSPRVVYGALSIATTFLVLASASGFSLRKPKLADLRPINIYRNADRQVHLVYARSTKFVSDLRVVYEIQSRLNEDKDRMPTTPEETLPPPVPQKEPGHSDTTPSGSPRQQNRANDLAERSLRVFAAIRPQSWRLPEIPLSPLLSISSRFGTRNLMTMSSIVHGRKTSL